MTRRRLFRDAAALAGTAVVAPSGALGPRGVDEGGKMSQDGCSCSISAPCPFCIRSRECDRCGGIFQADDDQMVCGPCDEAYTDGSGGVAMKEYMFASGDKDPLRDAAVDGRRYRARRPGRNWLVGLVAVTLMWFIGGCFAKANGDAHSWRMWLLALLVLWLGWAVKGAVDYVVGRAQGGGA